VVEIVVALVLVIDNGVEEDRALDIQFDLPSKIGTAAVAAFVAYIAVEDSLDHTHFHCCTYRAGGGEDVVAFVVFVVMVFAENARVADMEDKDIGAALVIFAVVALDVRALAAGMAYCDNDMEDSVLVAVEVASESLDHIVVMLQKDLEYLGVPVDCFDL